MSTREHWDRVYSTKGDLDVSWFEPSPAVSLSLIDHAGITATQSVIDVGGGNSRLVDALLDRGFRHVTVLDISAAALERTRTRLGERGGVPTWLAADVTGEWVVPPVDLWHDRAVLHFLTEPADQGRYTAKLLATVKAGGSVIVATFAPDGPQKCSGLPVCRYSADDLAALLGPQLRLEETVNHRHVTPAGVEQSFTYARFRRA